MNRAEPSGGLFMKKLFTAVLALALFLSACCPALAEAAAPSGEIARLAESVHALLFEANNVTLRGKADFSLGGERFKSAEILYKQAGEDSRWQLDLKTPRKYRSDLETGYTVIANGEKLYVMERYWPGTYTTGSDQPNSTVIGKSTRSELLYSLLLSLADGIESQLPAGAFTYPETEEACHLVEIHLAKETSPELLNSTLNLVADFFLRRFMGVNYESVRSANQGHPYNYTTVTEAVLYSTDSFVLGDTSVSVMTDLSGRFEAASGTVTALLSSEDYDEEPLQITFELTASDYGATEVEPFDPADYNVVPKNSVESFEREVDPAVREKMVARSVEVLAAAGYDTSSLSVPIVNAAGGFYYVSYSVEGSFNSISVGLNEKGELLTFADGSVDYATEHPRIPAENVLPEPFADLVSKFLSAGFPDLAAKVKDYSLGLEYADENANWQVVTPVDASREDLGIFIIMECAPVMRITYYTCLD